MDWKDVTNYSKGETRGETPPRTWETMLGGLRLVVTRHIHYPPDAWLANCEPFFSLRLAEKEAEAAQAEALALLRAALGKLLALTGGVSFTAVTEELPEIGRDVIGLNMESGEMGFGFRSEVDDPACPTEWADFSEPVTHWCYARIPRW